MQRQLALEVIVTLSETAAAMLRKHTAIVAQSGEAPVHLQFESLHCSPHTREVGRFSVLSPVPQMLAMMVDLEDDDEWAMADELEDDDFDRYGPGDHSTISLLSDGQEFC